MRLCLAEKGLAWTGHRLNLGRFDQLEPEFLALNPAGLVPVLLDGGQAATTRPALCQVRTAVKSGKEIDSDPDCSSMGFEAVWEFDRARAEIQASDKSA